MRLACCLAVLFLLGCGAEMRQQLVIYTSQDQFYAEPILRDFASKSGIEVRPVFDTESVKTAGLANRLRQEAAHPRCDLFWSNEEMHSRLLAADGVFAPESIHPLGFRTRRLVVNTNLLPVAGAPSGLLALTNAEWRGKIVLAYPLYGTTSSHFLALRQHWGEDAWRGWCEGLAANGARIVDGNSVVVRLVGAGEAWIGLTDSDDIAAGQRSGLPVAALPFSPEMLVIPNTVNLVRAVPATEMFLQFLSQPGTLARLVEAGALEGIQPPAQGLKIDWSRARTDFEAAEKTLKRIFLRG